MPSEADLIRAIESRLATMPSAPPIAYENVGFDQNNETYYKVDFLPAKGLTSIGSSSKYVINGIFQIMICVPKGTGSAIYTDELEKISARFEMSEFTQGSTTITCSEVWRNSALPDDNYFKIPVSIRYRAT